MSCQELSVYQRLPLPVRAAMGCELELADGARILDLYGGHCVNTLGAGDVGLRRAIQRQWEELSFATNLLEHQARSRFLEAFGTNLPPGEWCVFLSNSGAEANENALKAAFAATGRKAVVCFEGGFHGRTAAAAAVSDRKASAFPRTPFDVRRVPFDDADAASDAIDADVGAVILEPIQSLAGVVSASPEFLGTLRELCDARGAVLVFDEVQTGNGRLGTPWASQSFSVTPHAFTTAKGAAGGLPIGITVLSAELAEHGAGGGFGSTFGGGPTVLAAATEVAQRIAAPGFAERVVASSAALREAAAIGPVQAVRGRGLLLGLELAPGVAAGPLRDDLLREGVLVGTSDDPHVLRLTPPLTLNASEAPRLRTALEALEVATC